MDGNARHMRQVSAQRVTLPCRTSVLGVIPAERRESQDPYALSFRISTTGVVDPGSRKRGRDDAPVSDTAGSTRPANAR